MVSAWGALCRAWGLRGRYRSDHKFYSSSWRTGPGEWCGPFHALRGILCLLGGEQAPGGRGKSGAGTLGLWLWSRSDLLAGRDLDLSSRSWWEVIGFWDMLLEVTNTDKVADWLCVEREEFRMTFECLAWTIWVEGGDGCEIRHVESESEGVGDGEITTL